MYCNLQIFSKKLGLYLSKKGSMPYVIVLRGIRTKCLTTPTYPCYINKAVEGNSGGETVKAAPDASSKTSEPRKLYSLKAY
jgi:hypothetical protein